MKRCWQKLFNRQYESDPFVLCGFILILQKHEYRCHDCSQISCSNLWTLCWILIKGHDFAQPFIQIKFLLQNVFQTNTNTQLNHNEINLFLPCGWFAIALNIFWLECPNGFNSMVECENYPWTPTALEWW